MVLYAVYHGGTLPLAIIHKFYEHPNDEAWLLVGSKVGWHIGAVYKNIDKMSVIFDRVIKYDASVGYLLNDAEAMVPAIVKEYDKTMAENDVDLQAFDTIYNLVDRQDSFGIYLNIKKIPYTMLEITSGYFDKQTKGGCHPGTFELINTKYNEFNLFENPLITPIRYEQLDYLERINNLTPEQLTLIYEAYDLDVKSHDQKYNIFLPSSIAPIGWAYSKIDAMKNYYENGKVAYLEANNIYIDFFIPNNLPLIVKPHPSNPEGATNKADMTASN